MDGRSEMGPGDVDLIRDSRSCRMYVSNRSSNMRVLVSDRQPDVAAGRECVYCMAIATCKRCSGEMR